MKTFKKFLKESVLNEYYTDEQWKELDNATQQEYIKNHPNSKFAQQDQLEKSTSQEEPEKAEPAPYGADDTPTTDPRGKIADSELRNRALFNKYVPDYGKADTELGEALRAVNRIVYRFINDGDMLGHDYGKTTVNSPFNFLKVIARSHGDENLQEILDDAEESARTYNYIGYEHSMNRLGKYFADKDWNSMKDMVEIPNTVDSISEFATESDYDFDDDEEEYDDDDDYMESEKRLSESINKYKSIK